MNRTSRKRPLLEMLACVVLVAALAVQPALGRDAGKGKSRASVAPRAQSAAPATAKPARVTTQHSKGSNGRRTRQAAAADPAATAAPDPTAPAATPPPADTPPAAPPADPGTGNPPPPAVAPGTMAAPEDGATGAPPAVAATAEPGPAAEAPATPTPTPAAPESGQQTSRGPHAPESSAVAPTPAPDTAVGAGDREIVQSDAPLVTSPPPATAESNAATLDPLPADTAPAQTAAGDSNAAATAPPTASGRPSGDGGLPQARGVSGLLTTETDGTTGGTAPANSLTSPVNTPATAAQLRVSTGVRQAGEIQTSKPRPAADGAIRDLGPATTIATSLGKAVKFVPREMWVAIGALTLLVLLLAAHSVLAAARTRRLQRHREKLMEDIGLLQAALLPAVPTRMGALLTTVAYRPADGPAAGGDFYDAFALPDGRVGLLLGDVSGHGRQALAKTTLVRFTVRAHLEAGLSPREAIAISGRSLDGRLADDFSTVLAAVHDPATGTLTYASAGHPPPLVLGPSAHAPVTASSAPPIGVGFPTGQRQTMVPMPEGTTVAVYSDGLLEARIAGEPLGAERLAAWLAELGPEATAKQLLDLVVQRADRVPDDLAAVVIHAAPGATAPAARVEQLKLDVLDTEGPDLDGFLKAAGVAPNDRAIAGRRVSEQLAITGGVIVEVRTGEHPTVLVYAIGDRSGAPSHQSAQAY